MNNPYETAILGTEEFLRIAYTRMRVKVKRLQEIEDSKKRGKLPLPSLKEKFEITHAVLSALILLQNNIKDVQEYDELADLLGFIGIQISLGNISKTNEDASAHYQRVIKILNDFLG